MEKLKNYEKSLKEKYGPNPVLKATPEEVSIYFKLKREHIKAKQIREKESAKKRKSVYMPVEDIVKGGEV